MRALDPDRVVRWVGARVAEQRRALKLTQEELAERLGVSTKYLQRVEAGVENLTIRSLVPLANGLGISMLTLLDKPRNTSTRRPGRPSKN